MRDLVYLENELWHAAAAAALPPQHSFASAVDRKAVQVLMQRRADAKRNLSAGHVGAEVDLCYRSGDTFGMTSEDAEELLFSPSGDRLAVTDASTIAMYSVQDAKLLWQHPHVCFEQFIIKEKLQCVSHHGHSNIIVCKESPAHESVREHSPKRLRLLQYNALTGVEGEEQELRYADVPGMPLREDGSARVFSPTFSKDGKLLAVFSRATLFVVDAAMCTVQLSLPLGQELLIPSEGQGPGVFGHTCWSWDSTMITALGMLVNLQDGNVVELGPFNRFLGTAFDRSGKMVGMTELAENGFQLHLRVPSAVFTDASGPTSTPSC